MKAHLFAISLWGITSGVARHHDVAALEARQGTNIAVSVCYTYTTTYLTTIGPSGTTAPGSIPATSITVPTTVTVTSGAPTNTAIFTPVILGIEPIGGATRKRDLLKKRAGLGGFISTDVNNPNPSGCGLATIFQLQIGGGQFLDAGLPLSQLSGVSFEEFRGTGAPAPGAVTTTFGGVNGDFLRWTNSAFSSGVAGFCQLPSTGQVYITFAGQANQPAGCVAVELRIYLGRFPFL